MFRAVLFDFDGVITDSEILHLRAFNSVLSSHGLEITKKDYYTAYLGLTDLDCFKTLIAEGRLNLDVSGIDDLISQKSVIFEELVETEGSIIEGVRDFLAMLKHNSIIMAICSGALMAEIEVILGQARLRSFFEVVVSAEQVRRGKPDPEGFLLTLQKLNRQRQDAIEANECIVIEDSHWGLEAANEAGLHTVGVTNSYDAEQLTMAEKIVSHLGELNIENLRQLCS